MAIFLPILIMFLLLIGIVLACILFTNAIEWLGSRFEISQGAVGSIFAAIGTTLPETLVPIIALAEGFFLKHNSQAIASGFTHNAEAIGIGAILGAPFLLSTLAFSVTGLAVYLFAAYRKRGYVLHLDLHLFKRDLGYFFTAFSLVFLMSLCPWYGLKIFTAIFLVCFYAFYVYRTLRIDAMVGEEAALEKLIFSPKSEKPPTWLIFLQTFCGLAAIVLFAHLFVQQINAFSKQLHVSALLFSLIIIPIATELPEQFNSVIWISQKKDGLALGNITGAMLFQSCIPCAIGICFTPWVLNDLGLFSILLCLLSAGLVYISVVFRRVLLPSILLFSGLFYLIFLVCSTLHLIPSGG